MTVFKESFWEEILFWKKKQLSSIKALHIYFDIYFKIFFGERKLTKTDYYTESDGWILVWWLSWRRRKLHNNYNSNWFLFNILVDAEKKGRKYG